MASFYQFKLKKGERLPTPLKFNSYSSVTVTNESFSSSMSENGLVEVAPNTYIVSEDMYCEESYSDALIYTRPSGKGYTTMIFFHWLNELEDYSVFYRD